MHRSQERRWRAERTRWRGFTVVQTLLVCALLPPLQSQSTRSCSPGAAQRWNASGWPRELDVGIYWFGYDDHAEKAVPGTRSQFYDPAKKTFIYFHGWAGGHGGFTSHCIRITTECLDLWCPEEGTQLATEWLDRGWNVGFFYWDQFADEHCPRDAENKIWSDHIGSSLTWRSYDVDTQDEHHVTYEGPGRSVADIAVASVRHAMADYVGPHVRFGGHSIGAQLAVRCAAMLSRQGHHATPQRIALLEPYFTEYVVFKMWCSAQDTSVSFGRYIANRTDENVRTLWQRGIATEVYRSSLLSQSEMFGVPNARLNHETATTKYEPDWCGVGMFTNLECKHCAVFPLYFLALGEPATGGVMLSGSSNHTWPSPASSQEEITALVGQQWVQRHGKSTFTTHDDVFVFDSATHVPPPPDAPRPTRSPAIRAALAAALSDINRPETEPKPAPGMGWPTTLLLSVALCCCTLSCLVPLVMRKLKSAPSSAYVAPPVSPIVKVRRSRSCSEAEDEDEEADEDSYAPLICAGGRCDDREIDLDQYQADLSISRIDLDDVMPLSKELTVTSDPTTSEGLPDIGEHIRRQMEGRFASREHRRPGERNPRTFRRPPSEEAAHHLPAEP